MFHAFFPLTRLLSRSCCLSSTHLLSFRHRCLRFSFPFDLCLYVTISLIFVSFKKNYPAFFSRLSALFFWGFRSPLLLWTFSFSLSLSLSLSLSVFPPFCTTLSRYIYAFVVVLHVAAADLWCSLLSPCDGIGGFRLCFFLSHWGLFDGL